MATRNTRKSSSKRSGGGMLMGLFIGLVLGVAIAFGIAWYINKTPIPFASRANGAPEGKADAPPLSAKPAPLPGKPGDKPADKKPDESRFDFYKILPGDQAPAPTAKPDKTDAGAEPMFLQAGAFQNPADADNLKAKLALMGLEASVQQVSVPEKGTLHRVRIGPFGKPEDMDKARRQLAENGVQVSIVKGK